MFFYSGYVLCIKVLSTLYTIGFPSLHWTFMWFRNTHKLYV